METIQEAEQAEAEKSIIEMEYNNNKNDQRKAEAAYDILQKKKIRMFEELQKKQRENQQAMKQYELLQRQSQKSNSELMSATEEVRNASDQLVKTKDNEISKKYEQIEKVKENQLTQINNLNSNNMLSMFPSLTHLLNPLSKSEKESFVGRKV